MQVSAGSFDANSQSTTSPSVLSQLQTHGQNRRSASLSSGHSSLVTIKRPGSNPRGTSHQHPHQQNIIESHHHQQHRTSQSLDVDFDYDPTYSSSIRLGGDDSMLTSSYDIQRGKSVASAATAASAVDASEPLHATASTADAPWNTRCSVNRWSHSTSSSVTSLNTANTRRNRSSSGAVLTSLSGQQYQSPRRPSNIDASPRASPQRRNVTSAYGSPVSSPERNRRHSSRAENIVSSLTALPPLHTTPALTDPNDTESPSTSQTIPTPSGMSYPQHDYFDDSLSPYGMAKTKRVVMVRNSSQPVALPPPTRDAPMQPRPEMEQKSAAVAPELRGYSRPKQERITDKDKKTMLSKALQKANTAVLLDNAQNYEGALEAYGDACDLLTQVMERTSGFEDKQKLNAIRVTYSNRMEELRLLVLEQPTVLEEKDLPARPMSEDGMSAPAAQVSPIVGAVAEGMPFTSQQRAAPRLSYRQNDRDSFFSRTMAAVEDSASFTDNQPNQREAPTMAGAEQATGTSVCLPPPEHAQYMPRPLSPRRPSVPSADAPERTFQAEQDWAFSPVRDVQKEQPAPVRQRANSKEPTSWLDPLDESGSSCAASAHDRDSYHQGTHRKHLRDLSHGTNPDFDEAFDAAVEAAYDQGLEPDLEARRKRSSALKQRNESIQVPASEIDEIMPGRFQAPGMPSTEEDEEEERILDEITSDFGGTGFNFDLSSKSALPRQSDSSGYSRSTWQSSQIGSSRDTATTSLSTIGEDVLGNRNAKSTPLRESSALPPSSAPPTGALPSPPGTDSKRASNVRSRRFSGMNAMQLTIETVPGVRKRASTFRHPKSPAMDEDRSATGIEVQSSGAPLLPTPSGASHGHPASTTDLHDPADGASQHYSQTKTVHDRPSYEEISSDLSVGVKHSLFRKNKSAASLRDHTVLLASPDQENAPSMITPMSSTFMSFASKRNQSNPLTSQRANFPSLGHMSYDSQSGGGNRLFDTSLNFDVTSPRSPKSPSQAQPAPLEPCPDPFLLRPFWLMRALSSTIVHPRGGFVTSKLFVPREVWQTRGVKLKLVEDKVANCDLLTAALGRLAGVDTYDADAVKSELESFEEVMERAQQALVKKLGTDVGVHGIAGLFKDASAAGVASATGNAASDAIAVADKAAKSNSGKSYLTSWRKLRNKSSGTPLSGGAITGSAKTGETKDQHTMPSVPMTSFVPVERRGHKREARNLVFEGPNKEYMGSLARLFDGVQVLGKLQKPFTAFICSKNVGSKTKSRPHGKPRYRCFAYA